MPNLLSILPLECSASARQNCSRDCPENHLIDKGVSAVVLNRFGLALMTASASPHDADLMDAAGRIREEVRLNPGAMCLLERWGVCLDDDLDLIASRIGVATSL